MSFVPDMQKLRPNNMKLLDMIDAGAIDTTRLAEGLLGWMEDSQIANFCHANDIQLEDEEENENTDEEEGETDED
jgi:hypothetical protein